MGGVSICFCEACAEELGAKLHIRKSRELRYGEEVYVDTPAGRLVVGARKAYPGIYVGIPDYSEGANALWKRSTIIVEGKPHCLCTEEGGSVGYRPQDKGKFTVFLWENKNAVNATDVRLVDGSDKMFVPAEKFDKDYRTLSGK